MVPALNLSNSDLGRTPYRYYLVEVSYAAYGPVGSALSTYTTLASFPKVLMVDSGTTNVMVPGPNSSGICNTFTGITQGNQCVIVLKNNVVITYGPSDVVYAGGNPVFVAMDDATAVNFSSDLDVGILGCTGMRNLYVEFNLTKRVIGFAQLPS